MLRPRGRSFFISNRTMPSWPGRQRKPVGDPKLYIQTKEQPPIPEPFLLLAYVYAEVFMVGVTGSRSTCYGTPRKSTTISSGPFIAPSLALDIYIIPRNPRQDRPDNQALHPKQASKARGIQFGDFQRPDSLSMMHTARIAMPLSKRHP